MLTEIQDGTFAKKWIAENENGRPGFTKRATEQNSCWRKSAPSCGI